MRANKQAMEQILQKIDTHLHRKLSEGLQNNSEIYLEKHYKRKIRKQQYQGNRLDIGVLFAAPMSGNQNAVNYREEIKRLLGIIKQSKRKLQIQIENMNLGKLLRVINYRPKILHLICHGQYYNDRKSDQYIFEIEENDCLPKHIEKQVLKLWIEEQKLQPKIS